MKRAFFTGLALLLPLFITAIIILFVLNLFAQPFLGISEQILSGLKFLKDGFLFIPRDKLILYLSKALSLLTFFFLAISIGFAVQWFFIRKILRLAEKLFAKIPIVSKIYRATQEVFRTVFLSKKKSFGEVVLVPFPHDRGLSFGFVTRHATISLSGHTKSVMSVFVPATPNPTMGFMLLFPKEKVIKTDITVEEAMKTIVTCGTVLEKATKPS